MDRSPEVKAASARDKIASVLVPVCGASDRAFNCRFRNAPSRAALRLAGSAGSLAPQTGASTDAILSRAEAALTSGDLSAALAEIADLTPAPAAQMAAWKALVEQKLARQNALLSLRRLIEG